MEKTDHIKLKKNIRTLENVRAENMTPAGTVAALVDCIGYDEARAVIAAMVTSKGDWDERISAKNRVWASEYTPAGRDELNAAYIFYCDSIHPAHMDQIADVMREYTPAAAEPAAEPTPTAAARRAANKERRENLYQNILSDIRAGGYICHPCDGRPYLYTTSPGSKYNNDRARRVPLATMQRIAREPDMVRWRMPWGGEYVGRRDHGPHSDRRNMMHCKRIADDLNDIAADRVYKCPECGEEITLPDDVGDMYKCPGCGAVLDVNELEPVSVWDYLEDALDVEYRCSSRQEYRSVSVMVACGGPNIYIDTDRRKVLLYWWTERAEYDLTPEAVAAVDEWAEEYWGCM